MEKVTLKTRAAEKLEAWKKNVEELKNQMQHNSEEAKDSFEKQKAKLVKWTDEMKVEFERVEGIGEEKAKAVKGNLQDLRVQAALGRMESADALHDQQKKINHSIHNLKQSISKMEKDAEGNAKALLEKSNETLERYQNKFEMYRLQLMDAKEGAIESWQERKDDISLRLQKMSTKLEAGKEEASERWEGFSDEMSEAWTHFRKALKS
jgi:uncharacterized protein YoxC